MDKIKKHLLEIVPVLVITLFYWIITGFLPRFFLNIEFKEYFDLIAKRYHNLFIFPFVMGWIIPILIYPAIVLVWKNIDLIQKIYVLLPLLIVMIWGTILNDSDDYTIWEIKSEFLESTFISKSDLRSRLDNQDLINCDYKISSSLDTIKLINHFKNPTATYSLLMIKGDSLVCKNIQIEIGNAFHDKIEEILEKKENFSLTRYAYSISLALHIFTFLSVFLLTGIVFRKIDIEKSEIKKKGYIKAINRIAISLVVIIIWVFARMGNQMHKKEIYSHEIEITQEIINLGIILLFFLISFFIVGIIWYKLKDLIKTFTSFLSLAGLSKISFDIFNDPDIFNKVINQDGVIEVATFVVILVAAIVTFPLEENEEGNKVEEKNEESKEEEILKKYKDKIFDTFSILKDRFSR